MHTASLVILAIAAILSLLSGLGAAILGTSAIHEILTAIYFLIFVVALIGGGLLVGTNRIVGLLSGASRIAANTDGLLTYVNRIADRLAEHISTSNDTKQP